MQYLLDSYCDEGTYKITTTHGVKKDAQFSLVPDDGMLYVRLHSAGKYYVQIGYRYEGIFEIYDAKSEKYVEKTIKIDKYITQNKILQNGDSIDIPIGWNTNGVFNEEPVYDGINLFDDGFDACVPKIDIMKLEFLETCHNA